MHDFADGPGASGRREDAREERVLGRAARVRAEGAAERGGAAAWVL